MIISRRIGQQVLLGASIVLLLASSLTQLVSAAVNSGCAGQPGWYGRGCGIGYFYNHLDAWNGSDVLMGGIPNITTKQSFIDTIYGHLTSGDPQRITAAQFIILSMLGNNGGVAKSVSTSQYDDWKARVNSSNVIMQIDNVPFDCGIANSYYQYNYDDIAAGTSTAQEGCGKLNDMIDFYANGQLVYRIRVACANPLGQLPGLPQASQWTISATSTVNQPTAKPGDTLQWTHQVHNNGPDATDQTVYSQLVLGGFTNGWSGAVAGGNVGAGAGVGVIRTIPDYATYTVGQNDVGNRLCEYVQFNPAGNGGGSRAGSPSCVDVPYSYNLTPNVSLNGQTTVEAGGAASVSDTVMNGGATKSKNTDWRLTRMVFSPGTTLSAADLAARTDNSAPCVSFTATGRTACDVVQEDPAKVFQVGTNTAPLYNYTADAGFAVGTQICFAVSISPPTQDPQPSWRHSKLGCLTVSKKPKVQVRGGDLRSGGSVETGLSLVNGKTYGSWVEYGALSVGSNTGLASGSGLNNGGSTSPTDWNKLTFANVDNTGAPSYGSYAPSHAVMSPYFASLTSQFTAATPKGTATSTLDSLPSGTYSTGTLTINASTIGQDGSGNGKSIVILASGTVTIAGDIAYSGPGAGNSFTGINQIPQVVIVANAINITGTVHNIDAWLMTTGSAGYINTCSDVPVSAPLDATTCSNTLVVNGPVATAHLYLRRTAGADDASRVGDPAETLNLRADAYLSQHARASTAGKAETVYTTELPPRF